MVLFTVYRFDAEFQGGSTDETVYFTNLYFYGYKSSSLPSKQNGYNYELSLGLTIVCSVIFGIIGIVVIIKLVEHDLATGKRLFVACLTSYDIITDIVLSFEYIFGFGCDYCIYKYQIKGIIFLISQILGYILYFIGLKIEINNPNIDYTSKENQKLDNPLWITTVLQLIFEDVVAIVIVFMVSQDTQFMSLLEQMVFIQSMVVTYVLLYKQIAGVDGCLLCFMFFGCGPAVIFIVAFSYVSQFPMSCTGSCTSVGGF